MIKEPAFTMHSSITSSWSISTYLLYYSTSISLLASGLLCLYCARRSNKTFFLLGIFSDFSRQSDLNSKSYYLWVQVASYSLVYSNDEVSSNILYPYEYYITSLFRLFFSVRQFRSCDVPFLNGFTSIFVHLPWDIFSLLPNQCLVGTSSFWFLRDLSWCSYKS